MRSIRWSALLGVTFLFGCEVPAAPILVDGSQRFEPPPAYQLWWEMTQECSARRGRFETVRWYLVPGAQSLTVNGQRVEGYWTSRNTIVLAEAAMLKGPLVRHEMLHALQDAAGHPRESFLNRCGGVVVCDGQCATDAEPLPPPQPTALRVEPDGLEVDIQIRPQSPAHGTFGGFFTVTVTARNPRSDAVIVRLPETTFGEPSISFEYAMESAVAGDGRGVPALDDGVTRFAPGETKRQVFDFVLSTPGASGGLAPGAYVFSGAYGGNWAPSPRTVTVP
jgi:hypothetical protein